MDKPFTCSLCGKGFKTKRSVEDHQRDVHARNIHNAHVVRRNKAIDDEESMADRMIEAEENKAMGLPYEKWLLGE